MLRKSNSRPKNVIEGMTTGYNRGKNAEWQEVRENHEMNTTKRPPELNLIQKHGTTIRLVVTVTTLRP